MLEALVSSRIRRTLFEHLLTRPTDRFYLRGLAKELHLSISPLRRELKRLEHSGMLNAVQEGNMLFYTVETHSPAFVELARVTLTTPAPVAAERLTLAPVTQAPSGVSAPETPTLDPLGSDVGPVVMQPMPVGVISARPRVSVWQSPLSTPMLLGAAGVGMALLLVIGGLFYLNLTNQRILSQTSRALSTQKAEVTVVVPHTSSSSGVMRGARWQLVPGGFGGFSAAREEESY